MVHADEPIAKDIVQRAATWFVRVQAAPQDQTLRRRCDDWRGRHPHHELAWQRLQAINADMSSGLGRVAHPTLLSETLSGSVRGVDRRDVLKLLSLVAVGGAAWSLRDTTPLQRWRADYATAVGERRRIELPDHSVLQLDTATAVDLHFSATERLLELAHGALRISSGVDPQQRPLRVRTRHALFEAVGTVFTLRQEDGPTRLDVEEGAVIVACNGQRQTIAAGYGCVVDDSGIHPLAASTLKPGAWADGVLETQEIRLVDFIDEVARYRRGYLRCDARVADLRLSGVYQLDDTDRLLDIVTRALPVQVVYRTRWWVTVTARV